MTHLSSLTSAFPLMPTELPLRILVTDGVIKEISTQLNEIDIVFKRTTTGSFIYENRGIAEEAYLLYLQRQVNRLYN